MFQSPVVSKTLWRGAGLWRQGTGRSGPLFLCSEQKLCPQVFCVQISASETVAYAGSGSCYFCQQSLKCPCSLPGLGREARQAQACFNRISTVNCPPSLCLVATHSHHQGQEPFAYVAFDADSGVAAYVTLGKQWNVHCTW
jgi:hypothetical protein